MGKRLTEEQQRDAERIRRTLEFERSCEPKAVHAPKRGSCLVFVLFLMLIAVVATYVWLNWDRYEHLFKKPAPVETTPDDNL